MKIKHDEKTKLQAEWKQIRQAKKWIKDQKSEIEEQKKVLGSYQEKVLAQVKKQIRLMKNDESFHSN